MGRRSKFSSERTKDSRRSRSSSTSRSLSRESRRSRRSRSRSPTRRSTPSRSPTPRPRDQHNATDQQHEMVNVQDVKKLLDEQQDYMLELLSTYKEDLEPTTSRSFKKIGIEKQYLFNGKILKELAKLKRCLKKQHFEKSLKHYREAIEKLELQQQDLLVADRSPHGWLTVSMLHGNKDLPQDLLKKVQKIEARLDRNRRPQHGEFKKYTNKLEKSGGQNIRRRQGPEELLLQLKNRKRDGKCSHCEESGHFFRECPAF